MGAGFQNPDKPKTVKIAILRGNIVIHGTDARDVTVTTNTVSAAPSRNGLRVLTASGGVSIASSKENIVSIEASGDGMGSPSDVEIAVPRDANVTVVNAFGGDIACSDIAGDVEIKARASQITLTDLGGAAVVETATGSIEATLREIREGKPLSFTSTNGRITLRVPAGAKANLRMRTHNGVIETNFDEAALVSHVESALDRPGGQGHAILSPEARQAIRDAAHAGGQAFLETKQVFREATEAARRGARGEPTAPDTAAAAKPSTLPDLPLPPAIPALTGGKLVIGSLNGGGPEINAATMNGDITLMKSEN